MSLRKSHPSLSTWARSRRFPHFLFWTHSCRRISPLALCFLLAESSKYNTQFLSSRLSKIVSFLRGSSLKSSSTRATAPNWIYILSRDSCAWLLNLCKAHLRAPSQPAASSGFAATLCHYAPMHSTLQLFLVAALLVIKRPCVYRECKSGLNCAWMERMLVFCQQSRHSSPVLSILVCSSRASLIIDLPRLKSQNVLF